MKNITMTVTDRILNIQVDLSKNFGLSATKKSEIIATTEGNITIPGCENEKIGLNIYKSAK